jgi:type VI secretion system protein ImpA
MPLQTSELLQPIPGSSPGGADIRYEPIFDQIKRARTEEADLPAGDWSRERKTADWPLVVKLSTEVLSRKSKDLQVAAWLTEALLKREGITGLRSGVEIMGSLLLEFWDHLYPELEDGDAEFRAAPLEWVAQYLGASVRMVPINARGHTLFDLRESRQVGYESEANSSDKREARKAAIAAGKLTAEAFDEGFDATPKAWFKQLISDIDGSLSALDALDMVGQDRFKDMSPRYAPLRDAIKEVRQAAAQLLAKRLETDPDPIEAVPEPEVADAATGTVAGEAGASAATMSALPRNRADAEARVAAAARFLRAENPRDPAPYLMLRGLRWGELRAYGDRVEPKMLVAPPTELRSRLRGMLLDARWAQLLEASEDVMATPFGRGWLDLQRYVLAACAGLGGDYDHVAAAIRGALAELMRDLPHLPSLTLMDDTPTANVETQNWLRDLAVAPDLPVATAPAHAPVADAGRGAYERAMERVRAGESEKAIEMLIRLAAQEKSPRDRFLRRSQAASIMVESGREAVALPILEDLVNEIDKHTLEDWEAGETVAQPLGLLFRCKLRLEGESRETQSLYLRICKLDPLQAIQIAQPAQ